MKTSNYDFRVGAGLSPSVRGISQLPDPKKPPVELEQAKDTDKGDVLPNGSFYYEPDSHKGTKQIEVSQDDTMIITLTQDEYNEYTGQQQDNRTRQKVGSAFNVAGGDSRTYNGGGAGDSLIPDKPNLLLIGGLGIMAFLLIKK